MPQRRAQQKGNAVLIILIGVALFAALVYTFMRGSQQGSTGMSKQQARILATEILDYSRAVERGLNRLRSKRECSEKQISFDDSDSTTSGYENPYAPADKSYHLFFPEGGGVVFKKPPANALIPKDQTASYAYLGRTYNEYKFPSAVCASVAGPCDGTAENKDIVVGVEYLRREVCVELNKIVNHNSTPAMTGSTCSPLADTERYAGTFVGGGFYGCNAFPMECMHSARTGYTFFYLIFARP